MSSNRTYREWRGARAIAAAAALAAIAFAPAPAWAQGQRAIEQGPAPELPRTLKAAAPIDLTGTWVSVVTEDWRWRMMTPPRGDYAAIPLSAEGRRVADLWDPQADESAGLQCKWYGAPSIMRVPGRLNISWADDNTLQVQMDSGTQTRRLAFKAPPAAGERTWQGVSDAIWEIPEGAQPRTPKENGRLRSGSLKVVTTHFRAGYLRRNGVPYSENARLTEYFVVTEAPNGDQWLVVTAVVDDPLYLNETFVTSSHFKKERDNSKFAPSPCVASKEVFLQ
jgi:hypothetical protein